VYLIFMGMHENKTIIFRTHLRACGAETRAFMLQLLIAAAEMNE
jgi:hypothetical protein